MELFGLEIKKKKVQEQPSVVSPTPDDGATVVSNVAAYYGMAIDIEGKVKNENDLIRRYREVAQYTDCDSAIEDIVNEAIVTEPEDSILSLILEDLKVSEGIKTKFRDTFDEVIQLLEFTEKGHDIFRRWYIDGRLFYHVVIDDKNPKKGIQELRYVDPQKIRKIKNVKKERTEKGVEVTKVLEEYYLYNDKGLTEQTTQGVKLTLDSIIYTPSGLVDPSTGMVMSHLHKAVKPTNQLKMMEDALVIYRISRAPERRIFYVDVGNLPKLKAEQYVNDIMAKFKNKIVYDASTGEVRDDRKFMSMMEDFWMPRREGGKGTEITTLPGGQTLGQIEDIQYFQKKLYQSLNVPLSRLEPQQGFSLGRSTEISREEIKFNKFVNRLRKRFANLFVEALRIQLIAKGIIRADEWDEIKGQIRIDYQKDNHFEEFKQTELINNRIANLQLIDMFVGKYYSAGWVRKNVLMQTEEEIKEIDKEMLDDRKNQLDFASHEGEMNAARSEPTMDQQQDYAQQQADYERKHNKETK